VFLSLTRVVAVLTFSLCAVVGAAAQVLPKEPAAKLLTDKVGDYRAVGRAAEYDRAMLADSIARNQLTSEASRRYTSKDGKRFKVSIQSTLSDSAAYSLLTEARIHAESSGNEGQTKDAPVGSTGFSYDDGANGNLLFCKGRAFVVVHGDDKTHDHDALVSFAKTFAETLDAGGGEIPVLVKHLPNWESVRLPLYAVNVETLKARFGENSVFSAVSFAAGAEAVSADYGKQQLVLIEYNTPQAATEQNEKIRARIQELRSQGQPAPTAYRRVGNYAVFAFDAPNEQAANQLIDQVKYQQVVQWLGENPFSYERATREFTETTLGVFVSVVKASGLALITCLAVGGFCGALLFSLRRSQQRNKNAFADSDAMLRLNLDQLSSDTDRHSL
jgi:hypothetical protein